MFELLRSTNPLVTEPEDIAVLNVAVTLFPTGTPMALGTGDREDTNGEVGAAAVVNVQASVLITLPERS